MTREDLIKMIREEFEDVRDYTYLDWEPYRQSASVFVLKEDFLRKCERLADRIKSDD